jgi:hypothetical protein
MSVRVRPINANLTHDTETFGIMVPPVPIKKPYVKIYFGGAQYRTKPCQLGGKTPSWNETFMFNPTGDSNMRIEVWDSDAVNDDLVGEGSYNLMRVYNTPSMRNDHGTPLLMQNTSTSSTRASRQGGYSFRLNCRG